MYYAKITNNIVSQFPYELYKLKSENPNTSFPKQMTAEVLAAWGLYEVTLTASPVIDNRTQTADYVSTPTKAADGTWELLWIVTDKSAAAVAEYDATLAVEARNQRDSLMSETDWAGLSDTTMTPEMLTYRQELRDVPAQSGFPTSVAWPLKPGA